MPRRTRTPGISRYVEFDTDVLDAADAYLAYLLPRAAQRPSTIGNGPAKGRSMRRMLHSVAIYRAWQLLNLQRYHGYAWLRETWRYRLELAGIDPDSMLVVDQRRWARAWELLKTTWKFRKSDAIRGNTLNWDAPWPCEPVERGLRKAPRKPKKELEHIIQERDPAQKKFDLIRRFRKTIWSPYEQTTEPRAGDWEYCQQERCSMPIPDAQDGYGTVIHTLPSW